MKPFPRIATALLILGGLNWGLMGFFEYDLIANSFGGQATNLSRFIYSVVGLCAFYQIFNFPRFYRTDSTRSPTERRETAVANKIDRAA